jgi:hypothetical protein
VVADGDVAQEGAVVTLALVGRMAVHHPQVVQDHHQEAPSRTWWVRFGASTTRATLVTKTCSVSGDSKRSSAPLRCMWTMFKGKSRVVPAHLTVLCVNHQH